jgi:hypothetical protein
LHGASKSGKLNKTIKEIILESINKNSFVNKIVIYIISIILIIIDFFVLSMNNGLFLSVFFSVMIIIDEINNYKNSKIILTN